MARVEDDVRPAERRETPWPRIGWGGTLRGPRSAAQHRRPRLGLWGIRSNGDRQVPAVDPPLGQPLRKCGATDNSTVGVNENHSYRPRDQTAASGRGVDSQLPSHPEAAQSDVAGAFETDHIWQVVRGGVWYGMVVRPTQPGS